MTLHGSSTAPSGPVFAAVDDHPALLEQLGPLVERLLPGARWAGVVASVAEVELLAALALDVVLVDLSLPGQDPAHAVRRLTASGARCAVLTFEPHQRSVLDLVAAGARAVVAKSDPSARIAEAVDALHREGIHLGAELAHHLLGSPRLRAGLGAHERRAVELLADGVPADVVVDVTGLGERSELARLVDTVCARLT